MWLFVSSLLIRLAFCKVCQNTEIRADCLKQKTIKFDKWAGRVGESRAINSSKGYWINYKTSYDLNHTTDLSLLCTMPGDSSATALQPETLIISVSRASK